MIFVNKVLYRLLFSFSLISAVFPQTAQQQYEYGLSLYNKEEYFFSVTELKRLLFFDTTGIYRYDANMYIGNAYKGGARFTDAINYFTDALAAAENPDKVFATKIEIIKSNILRKSFKQAHQILNDLESSGLPGKEDELNYWRGWVYIFSDEWDQAAISFRKINEEHELAVFTDSIHAEKYSVLTAKILSYVLPGAGQFYTGSYISGLLSLGWNVLWGYITINSFVEDRIFDGFAVANFLWLRFYNGNVQNAEKFAIQKNIEVSNRAFRYLQHEYSGRRP